MGKGATTVLYYRHNPPPQPPSGRKTAVERAYARIEKGTIQLANPWLERSCHPKLVTTVRVNKTVIDADVANRVMFFLGLYVVWMTFGIFFMSFAGLPFEGAVTSVIATMNNCGPGLGVVGPTTDFSDINMAGTIYLTVNMLVGRLEMVTFLVLLLPSFWRRD